MCIHEVTLKNLDVREQPQKLEKARLQFAARGESIAQWARDRGYKPIMVTGVLNGRYACLRGSTHKIAVDLGLKKNVQKAA